MPGHYPMQSSTSLRRRLLSDELATGLRVTRMGDEDSKGKTRLLPRRRQAKVQAPQAYVMDVNTNIALCAYMMMEKLLNFGVPYPPEWLERRFETKTRLRIIAFSESLRRQLCWPYFKDLVQLFECSHDEMKDDFGVGYLVFTHAGCLGSQVLETSVELRDVMVHILEWFVRPRETGYGYFHFSWNEARKTRQLDTHFDLRMDDLIAFTQQEVYALRKFASDVNLYEGREAFRVLYDPKAFECRGRRASMRVPARSRHGKLKPACSTCGGHAGCSKLEDICNHCGGLLPCSSLTDSCSHCRCLIECTDGSCNHCGPYTLLFCRHCGLYPSLDEGPPVPSDDSSDDYPIVNNSPDNSVLEQLFLDPAQSHDSDDNIPDYRVQDMNYFLDHGFETREAMVASSSGCFEIMEGP